MGRVRQRYVWLRWVGIAALLAARLACGQGAVTAAQAQTVVDVLHQLSDKADVIFAGQVVAIRRPNDGVVEVEFRVDEAVRGCVAGQPYILREWAGLWAGSQRYRVGQRLLMLLHAPSATGMSSPVGGLDGAIPIRLGGSDQGGAGTSLADKVTPLQVPFVDLRWLGVRLPRVVTYRSETVRPVAARDLQAAVVGRQMAQPMGALAQAGFIVGAAPIVMSSDASSSKGSVPAQQASVSAVMEMLGSWERTRHVAP
jgi:hypothetical protein